MAQIGKISEQVQLKCSSHKLYDFLKNKMDSLFPMFPEIYKSYNIVEGNGYAHGSILHLKYDFGGLEEVKERIAIDDANKSITFECLEGDLLRYFKVFLLKIQVIDKGSNGCSINWTIEFVKANDEVASPYNFLPFTAKISKGLDDHLCNN